MNRIRGEGGRFHSGSVKKRKEEMQRQQQQHPQQQQQQQQTQQRSIGVSYNNIELATPIIIEVS